MKKNLLFTITLLLSTLLFFPACKEKSAQSESPQKDIYIQLYSVRDDIKADYDATIKAVAEMGYIGIEAAGYNDGQFYGMDPVEFKKTIEDAGMEVLSSHATHPLAPNPSESDWDAIWTWWDTAIEAHKAAGMKYIVAPWMPAPETIEALDIYCQYYNEVGEKCNAAGLRFGYHNHDFEFKEVEDEVMYDYLINNTAKDKVFYQMDVYWVLQGGQDPVEYFNKYPGRFDLLHIKDEKEIGESGEVDFEKIFTNIDNSGAKYMIVEVERYTGTPIEGVRESIDYLINAEYVKDTYK